jgi:PTH2 family peptidyl-tRNA hydrolase
MRTGKIAAQCCHAALGVYEELMEIMNGDIVSSKRISKIPISLASLPHWQEDGQAKVVVSIPSYDVMQDLHRAATKLRLSSFIVHDAGRTQVAPGSATVIAIGPGPKQLIDKITGSFKLL